MRDTHQKPRAEPQFRAEKAPRPWKGRDTTSSFYRQGPVPRPLPNIDTSVTTAAAAATTVETEPATSHTRFNDG